MKKRTISLILLVSMLASLVACGGESGQTDTTTAADSGDTTTAEVATTPAEPLELPEKDWGERLFNVLGYDAPLDQFDSFEIFSEGETGDVVNDAIYRRNRIVEDKYNVEIIQTLAPHDDWAQGAAPELRKSTAAGDNEYDLVFLPLKGVGPVAREGLLVDLYGVDHINFDKSWWNKDVNDTIALNNKLYFTTSDYSLRDKAFIYIYLYNKKLMEDFSLGNPVELVRAGTWTFDTMLNMAKEVAFDLNPNSSVDDQDRFGIGLDAYGAASAFYFSMDNWILQRESDGDLSFALGTERAANTVEKIAQIFANKALFTSPEDYNDDSSISSKTFKAGRSLFVTAMTRSLKSMFAECADPFGIIPYPKYDESQEDYYSLANDFAMVFGIPTQASDPNFSGFMLEALSHYSTDTTLTAYYEVSCQTKYTFDEDSPVMLDWIFDGIRFDLSSLYGIGILTDFMGKYFRADNDTFASSVASVKESAEQSIKDLMADFE